MHLQVAQQKELAFPAICAEKLSLEQKAHPEQGIVYASQSSFGNSLIFSKNCDLPSPDNLIAASLFPPTCARIARK